MTKSIKELIRKYVDAIHNITFTQSIGTPCVFIFIKLVLKIKKNKTKKKKKKQQQKKQKKKKKKKKKTTNKSIYK